MATTDGPGLADWWPALWRAIPAVLMVTVVVAMAVLPNRGRRYG